MVMVLIGVVAAIGVPRLMGDNSFATSAFGDEVVSALRTAQKTAVARRRLVCAQVGGSAVILRQAAAPNEGGCSIALDADSYATGADGVAVSNHTLFFQPNGLVTSDTAGRNAVRASVVVSLRDNARRTIVVEGSTGYVQ